MYLHHVAEPLEVIKGMARTLKPGGKLVITDMDKHDYNWLKEEQHDWWMGFDRDDVREWFEQAGLRNVSVDFAGEE